MSDIPPSVLAYLRERNIDIAAFEAFASANTEGSEGDSGTSTDPCSEEGQDTSDPDEDTPRTHQNGGDLMSALRAASTRRLRAPVAPVAIPMTPALEAKLLRAEIRLVDTLFEKKRRLGDLINLPLRDLVQPCLNPGSYVIFSPEQVGVTTPFYMSDV